MIVYTKTYRKILVSDEIISAGGEGEVHRVVDTRYEYRDTCVKIYFKKKLNKLLHDKIKYMVSYPPDTLIREGFKICWPTETIYNDKNEFIGFLMPLAFPDSIKLTYLTSTTISKKEELKELRDKFSRDRGGYTFFNRLKLINNLLRPICIIHQSDSYVIHDLKPDNILVDSHGKVSIIDMDSIQISHSSFHFPGSAATFEYIPTEFYMMPNVNIPKDKTWDLFAVGVILYELMFGLHPFLVSAKNAPEYEDGIQYYIN